MTDSRSQQGPEDGRRADEGAWTIRGVSFPAGTEFRSEYKGKLYVGRVESGSLLVLGKRFSSPSAAAVEITKRAANGWTFWECRFPGTEAWVSIKTLRS
jgi:hypothetical protein